jgi:hypothetical protein
MAARCRVRDRRGGAWRAGSRTVPGFGSSPGRVGPSRVGGAGPGEAACRAGWSRRRLSHAPSAPRPSSATVSACGADTRRVVVAHWSVVVLAGPARGTAALQCADPRDWMQARDPKRDRPAGGLGRPAFGVGPIARVSRPPSYVPSRPPGPEDRRPPEAVAPPSPVRTGGGLAARTPMPVRSPYAGRSAPPVRSPFPTLPPGRGGFGLPNLRRNVCPHFYMTGSRGAIPIQAPHLLKALIRQDANVSRCQLRGGVHLEQGYVNDVCLTPRFNQCVFYEDDLTRE